MPCDPCLDDLKSSPAVFLIPSNSFGGVQVIYRYGIIWLLWIFVNRFLCEKFNMADSLLNFAQIAGNR